MLIKKGAALKQTPAGAGGEDQTIFHHTDHLSGAAVDTNEQGEIVNLIDYYPFGTPRLEEGSYENDYKYTGHEYDDESGLYYMKARYQDPSIGRFVSQDPVFLAVGDADKLKEITGLKLEDYLKNPQGFNSYSYTVNNPLKYVDNQGEFYGEFGRDLSSGQRTIANFLYGAADYIKSQGGIINNLSGFVNNTLGDFVSSVADVFDPDQNVGVRAISLGLVALDTSTGGEGRAIGQGLKNLPRVFSAQQKLNNLSKIFGKSVNEILDATASKGVKYIDNANKGNINILTPKPGQSNDFIRVTLDPKQEKIISAGHVRQSSLNKYINNGRFTPVD